MALSNIKKEQIAHSVIKVLHSRFNLFPSKEGENRNAPFHIAFLQAFQHQLEERVRDIHDFISLSSWMHGLNTSLGQSFFESVAHILCDGEKREFKSKRVFTNQINAIAGIMTDLKNGNKIPSLMEENDIITQNANGEEKEAPNFIADCFYETDDEVVAIELKSVRPNSGEMRGEKQKILIGRAVLQKLFPNKKVKYLFGFPFDPTAGESVAYDKARFLSYLVEADKFVAYEDFLIADELWSFLASEESGVMQEILDIINRIATPEFMDKFNQLQDNDTGIEEKKAILAEWYLCSEVKIIETVEKTKKNCRLYNQSIFKTDGSYNDRRLELLH